MTQNTNLTSDQQKVADCLLSVSKAADSIINAIDLNNANTKQEVITFIMGIVDSKLNKRNNPKDMLKEWRDYVAKANR